MCCEAGRGNGIEVLYEMAAVVWEGDVNAALNYLKPLASEGEMPWATTLITSGSSPLPVELAYTRHSPATQGATGLCSWKRRAEPRCAGYQLPAGVGVMVVSAG